MMLSANYTYRLEECLGRSFIVIEDRVYPGDCTFSVFDNMEKIVDEIATKEKLNPVEHHIIYRDEVAGSRWNGYLFSTREFIFLGKRTPVGAMHEMIKQAMKHGS